MLNARAEFLYRGMCFKKSDKFTCKNWFCILKSHVRERGMKPHIKLLKKKPTKFHPFLSANDEMIYRKSK